MNVNFGGLGEVFGDKEKKQPSFDKELEQLTISLNPKLKEKEDTDTTGYRGNQTASIETSGMLMEVLPWKNPFVLRFHNPLNQKLTLDKLVFKPLDGSLPITFQLPLSCSVDVKTTCEFNLHLHNEFENFQGEGTFEFTFKNKAGLTGTVKKSMFIIPQSIVEDMEKKSNKKPGDKTYDLLSLNAKIALLDTNDQVLKDSTTAPGKDVKIRIKNKNPHDIFLRQLNVFNVVDDEDPTKTYLQLLEEEIPISAYQEATCDIGSPFKLQESQQQRADGFFLQIAEHSIRDKGTAKMFYEGSFLLIIKN